MQNLFIEDFSKLFLCYVQAGLLLLHFLQYYDVLLASENALLYLRGVEI